MFSFNVDSLTVLRVLFVGPHFFVMVYLCQSTDTCISSNIMIAVQACHYRVLGLMVLIMQGLSRQLCNQ